MVIDFISNEYSSRVHYRNGYMILNGGALIYNADSKALIHSTSVGYYFNVSDDGKYFYNNDGIYEINNNVVSFVTSTDTGSSVHTVEFLSDQNKCIYSNKFSNPVIYDFNSGTKSIMTNITEVNDLQYDQSTGKVLFSQLHTDAFNGHKSFINVYNTSDQTFKRLQVYDSHYSHIYRFYNNTLIFSGGLYLNQYFNN